MLSDLLSYFLLFFFSLVARGREKVRILDWDLGLSCFIIIIVIVRMPSSSLAASNSIVFILSNPPSTFSGIYVNE